MTTRSSRYLRVPAIALMVGASLATAVVALADDGGGAREATADTAETSIRAAVADGGRDRADPDRGGGGGQDDRSGDVRSELVPAAVVDRLSRALDRAQERLRPRHPVRTASYDYGDSGAVFGAGRSGHIHEGQDVFAPAGTPLVAVTDGEVVEAGTDGGRGNHVTIHDPERDQTYVYFHMLAPTDVAVGDRVRAGQPLGEVGCTGSCFGDHLHFEVRDGRGGEGRAIDPLPLLERWER